MKKIGKTATVLIIVAVVIVLIAGWFISSYNSLVSENEAVKTSQSQIQNQLQRRNDLIPNLVSTVKGYASHEQSAIDAVTSARAKMAGASTNEQLASADAELTSALNNLLVIVENYPDLKANENFARLQDELAGTENRISVARKDFNEAAQKFNTKIKRFPINIAASIFGFNEYQYFETTVDAQNVPKVEF